MCNIVNPHTGKVLLTASYERCLAYIRWNIEEFDAGLIDIVYVATGRYASFVL